MLPDEEGFLQPVVDAAKCVTCGKCEAVCPVLHPGKPRKPLAVYAAKAKDDELRWGSASGGVFTVLAQDVLKRGGVVFGAGFERPTWRVVHKAATNEEELDDLRGSKYVQSDTGDTFKEAKFHLDAGREVLYSGCPCQIAALKSFLGKDYPNLLTVDLICHGVPSPLAWQKFLNARASELGATGVERLVTVRFREKSLGWRNSSLVLTAGNRRAYSSKHQDDLFMRGYLGELFGRLSCYRCCFKAGRSGADLTLGDYWCTTPSDRIVDDDRGVSSVLANTIAGVAGFKNTWRDMTVDAASLGNVCAGNPVYKHSTRFNGSQGRRRTSFFSRIKQDGFDRVVRETLALRDCFAFSPKHLAWWVKRFLIDGEVNKL